MKILVTGSKGFIGSAYVKRMRKDGHTVIDYDLPDNDICNVLRFGDTLYIKRPDMVVHFAAIADLYQSIEDQDKNFKVNIEATYNIGQACSFYKVPLVFISTCCVYGNYLDEIGTESRTKPCANEPYATSKIAGEAILRGIPNLRYTVARIGTVYGVGMREALFTYIALDKILSGETIEVHGDGQQSRQLIYIDDLIEGLKLATELFEKIEELEVNFCSEEQISVLDTIHTAEKIIGKKATTKHVQQRYGQTYKETISIDRAKELLGWKPRTKFNDGMTYAFVNDKRFNK